MNETQLWYCVVCDKTINFISNLRPFNSKTHIHKKQLGTVVKEYKFIRPEIDEVNFLFKETVKDCRKKYIFFHLNVVVYMNLNLQLGKMMKKLF